MNANHYIRKIANRTETVTENLDEDQVAAAHRDIVALLGQRDALKQKLKTAKSEIKAQGDAIEQRILIARARTTGKGDVDVAVQDWLTKTNEVATLRVDTKEVLATRTATSKELQDDLQLEDGFGSDPQH